MNPKIKAVLFDVDGVLADSFEANRKFFSDVSEKFGYRSLSREEYVHLFHKPIGEVIKHLTGTSGSEFQKIYEYSLRQDTPYEVSLIKIPDHTDEVLSSLSQKYKIGIVTSRNKVWVFDGPQEFKDLAHYFEVIVALEDVKNPKPDPEGLLQAAKKLNAHPHECVYIGDTENDMAAALNAGMSFIHYSMEPHPDAHAGTVEFAKIPEIIECL